MLSRFGIKQFRSEGCLSYLVWERASRMAAAIDPAMDLLEDYQEFLAGNRLNLVYAFDTHTHADHFSATHELKKRFAAQIGMSHQTRSQRPTLRLVAGRKLALGDLQIEVLETPGHTPDSMCLKIENAVFTGDTLLIGSTGRTDFPGSDPKEQWHSLHKVLGVLPDDTAVFPGHDYSQMIFSTIETEKKRNPHLAIDSVEEFEAMKRQELLMTAQADIQAQLEFNQAEDPPYRPGMTDHGPGARGTACGAALEQEDRYAVINVDKYRAKLDAHKKSGDSTGFVDVREPEEFQDGHIPGTINIPLSEVGVHVAELKKAGRLYLSCFSGRRSGMVARNLVYLGLEDVVNVAGGFQAWSHAGFSVES